MAQFDVYANPSRSRGAYPYLVDIQHDLIAELDTRLVIPLVGRGAMDRESLRGLTPELLFRGQTWLLFTPQLSAISLRLLDEPIGSLVRYREKILGALDFAISGY